MAKMKWEYEIQNISALNPDEAANTMNEMGYEGWEIFTVVPGDFFKDTGKGYFWVMAKRPTQPAGDAKT